VDAVQEPEWLDPEERGLWFAFAWILVRLPAALDTQMQRAEKIGHFDYLVMSALSMAPQRRLRLSDLGELIGSSLSRLSNVIGKLEKRGWVRRESDLADGRYTLGILTEQGFAKVTQAAPSHVAEVRRLVLDPLTREQRLALRDASLAMLRAIDPGAADAGRAVSSVGL
jgi:DNA-binding MarR family transcriptional regulator